MLKVDSLYRIYGLGFENTVKSLVKEGFIDFEDIACLKTDYDLCIADRYDESDYLSSSERYNAGCMNRLNFIE
ncbi:MAG: hypothetical protein K0S76_173 [Herbinix sp.]|jgi:hypothetical protein|nr:hypothetical protein [Herbinix sp.]